MTEPHPSAAQLPTAQLSTTHPSAAQLRATTPTTTSTDPGAPAGIRPAAVRATRPPVLGLPTAGATALCGPPGGPSADGGRASRAAGPGGPTELDDLTELYEHTALLGRARGLDATLAAVLGSGAALLRARRGFTVTAAPGGPGRPVGLGLDRPGLGALETVPTGEGPVGGLLRGHGRPRRLVHTDLVGSPATGPRLREVAAQLGLGACVGLPLATEEDGPLAAAVWFFDEPTVPDGRRLRLAEAYCEFAAPLLAGQLAAERSRRTAEALRRGLLPGHLPRVPGVRLAGRCVPADLERSSGSDWYDAIALPDGTLGLSVGSVSGDGPGAGPASAPGAAAAMGRIRAALRAYAVLEGEDPVSVLGDLELLLKTTEPARSATAAYAWVEPAERRITLAGAGHCPPVLVTGYGANFVETSLSAPLGMLSCWEAPGVELDADRGDLLVLYTEGLARRFGPTLHAGQAALRRAAADAPREVRADPDRLCTHLLARAATAGGCAPAGTDDLVLLAARFE
ncbi:PP2C family protein-serine/threonine phosphatase [Kitasatospora sp. NBC_00315]|uniref:PP2C family protein-serine/threonine phosphatase n=1 Tax=Kitasatospora sp. NBC_00315 TaxID=2975963 RepID=UPI00324632A9